MFKLFLFLNKFIELILLLQDLLLFCIWFYTF